MAQVRPFRALRYDESRVGAVANAVCPPYDVISPAEQHRLYELSPYNAVRLECARVEPTDTAENNRYSRASQTLHTWLEKAILRRDAEEALYVYEQTFEHRGQVLTRRTIFAAVRLEEWSNRVILPHERTMASPKTDRLQLLEATNVQFSPVMGLFEDPGHELHRAFDEYTVRKPASADFFWFGQERQRFWAVTEQRLIERFTAALADRRIVIADGHHRYETALRYRDERRAANPGAAEDAPWNWILMGLTSVEDPGLVILPTHRLVAGVPLASADLERGLAHWFDVEPYAFSTRDAMVDVRQMLRRLAELGRDFHVVGLCDRGERLLLARLTDPDVMEQLAPSGHSEVWKHLDVSIAQTLIVHGVVGIAPGEEGLLDYTRDEEHALEVLQAGQAWLAIFLNPPRVDQVVAVAKAGDVMPEKSTYFYPKLLTGLVFYPLS